MDLYSIVNVMLCELTGLSCVHFWSCPNVQLFSFISLYPDLLQVSFGFFSLSVSNRCPLYCDISWVHFAYMLHTCSIYCHFPLLTWDSGMVLVLIYNSLLEMVFGQKTRSKFVYIQQKNLIVTVSNLVCSNCYNMTYRNHIPIKEE